MAEIQATKPCEIDKFVVEMLIVCLSKSFYLMY